jgi:hypothetical protein
MPTLSPTPRTTGTRESERAVTDRERLLALLSDALVAHLGVVVSTGSTSEGSSTSEVSSTTERVSWATRSSPGCMPRRRCPGCGSTW